MGHPIKRKRVLTFLKKEKAEVVFLQKTYLSSEEHKKTQERLGRTGLFFKLYKWQKGNSNTDP